METNLKQVQEQIGIVGLGLLGGSVGLAATRAGKKVIGIDSSPQSMAQALNLGAVQTIARSYRDLAACPIVVICTPIQFVVSIVEELSQVLNPVTIVTDVASTKARITDSCSKVWKNFVPGHPMRGGSKQGIASAREDLFDLCTCILTPVIDCPKATVAKIDSFWRELGAAHVLEIEALEHDRILAYLSHLPQMVSSALVAASTQVSPGENAGENIEQSFHRMIGRGFLDTTRVGGGIVHLKLDMARENRVQILQALKNYTAEINMLYEMIQKEHWVELKAYFEWCARVRNSLDQGELIKL